LRHAGLLRRDVPVGLGRNFVHIEPISGAEGARVRRRIAAITHELLGWAEARLHEMSEKDIPIPRAGGIADLLDEASARAAASTSSSARTSRGLGEPSRGSRPNESWSEPTSR